ncbi:MAG: class I SAM-dependent methyltransferase [Actinobacteria bacterium]|nr:class I SAM-dependent methyltransferase [Actinomycetota bacterium]MCL5025159.1 class I SAM-dependent methyltransferase [Chloroflexota bacterium]
MNTIGGVDKEQRLISRGISEKGGRWADFGSGTGIFTLALSNLIGPDGEIYSLDRDGTALARQEAMFSRVASKARVHFLLGNFTRPLELPPLDGIVMANSLHFVEKKEPVLGLVKSYLKPEGRLIVVEYNTSSGNCWVPYPIDFASYARLALRVGFAEARLLDRIPSSFLKEMYSCLCLCR